MRLNNGAGEILIRMFILFPKNVLELKTLMMELFKE